MPTNSKRRKQITRYSHGGILHSHEKDEHTIHLNKNLTALVSYKESQTQKSIAMYLSSNCKPDQPGQGRPLCCVVLSSIPGLDPLDTRNTCPQLLQPAVSPDIAKLPMGWGTITFR